MLWLGIHTSNIGLMKLLYISIEAGLGVSLVNEFQYFVLAEVSGKDMIMIIPENMYIEIPSRWYINSIIKMKKTVGVHILLAICRDMFCSNWITRKS